MMECKIWTVDEYEAFAKAYAIENSIKVKNAILAGKNVLCPAKAGTGKSFTVERVLEELGLQCSEYVKVSFVGIAALVFGGRTINSTFKFPTIGRNQLKAGEEVEDYLERMSNTWVRRVRSDKRMKPIKELLNGLKLMVNDEISMTSGIFLRFIDICFRKFKNIDKPFGDIRMIFLGDFFQLECVESVGREPDYCYHLLEDFEKIVFDFGHRYMIREDDHYVEQVGFVDFLSDLRRGRILEKEFLEVGFKVITEDEYLNNLDRFDRLVIAQSNRKVNEWNQRVTEVYESKGQTPSKWSSDIYTVSTTSGTPVKDVLSDVQMRHTIIAAIREKILISSDLLQDKFAHYCDTSFGEDDVLDFDDYIIDCIQNPDSVSDDRKQYIKEVLDVLGCVLKIKKLDFMSRVTKVDLDFTGTVDGETPIALPHDLEIRNLGPVLVRVNKPNGYEDLANGSILTFVRIDVIGKDEYAILQDTSEPPKEYKLSKIMRYAMNNSMHLTFQFPFISADASTTHKIQGTSLDYAGFLLDGSYCQRHSHYVAVSRVRNPNKFVYICTKNDLRGLSDVDIDRVFDPDVQRSRLKKIFKKVRSLVSVHHKTYELVTSWEA